MFTGKQDSDTERPGHSRAAVFITVSELNGQIADGLSARFDTHLFIVNEPMILTFYTSSVHESSVTVSIIISEW